MRRIFMLATCLVMVLPISGHCETAYDALLTKLVAGMELTPGVKDPKVIIRKDHTVRLNGYAVVIQGYASNEADLARFLHQTEEAHLGLAAVTNRTPQIGYPGFNFIASLVPDYSALNSEALEQERRKSKVKPFEMASASPSGPETEPNLWAWAHEGVRMQLHRDGTLRFAASPKIARLRMPGRGVPGRVSVADIDGDLVLGYERGVGQDSDTRICRVRKDLKSIRWCQHVIFNLVAAMGDSAIWVGGFGLIGRIDPSDGRFVWVHKNQTRPNGALGSFSMACVKLDDPTKGLIVFRTIENGAMEVHLNRETGEIRKMVNAVFFGYDCR